MNKILFLDRDGVINFDYGHVYRREEFKFINGIFDLCKKYQGNGFIIVVITNQAGIGKGLYSIKDFNILTKWMIYQFKINGVNISKVYFCPCREEESCYDRKPNPGLFIRALKDFNGDPTKSVSIGDKMTDIEAAHRAGISTLIFKKGLYPFKAVTYKVKIIKNLYDCFETV